MRVLSIGGGNMASAILRGAVGSGAVPPSKIRVVDPNDGARDRLASDLGVYTAPSLDGLNDAERGEPLLVLLAGKPQIFPDAAPALAQHAEGANATAVSIMAGVRAADIAGAIGFDPGRVVRTMPHTPAALGKGVCAVATDSGASEDALSQARGLLASTAALIDLPESLIDAFTGVAGSGPAYVFAFVEALEAAAREAGLDADAAATAARQTVIGAAALLDASSTAPADLRRAVTSPKGTTEAGLAALAGAGFEKAVRAAVLAARDRGVSLASAAASET